MVEGPGDGATHLTEKKESRLSPILTSAFRLHCFVMFLYSVAVSLSVPLLFGCYSFLHITYFLVKVK